MKMVVHKTVTILLQGVKDFGLRIVQSKVLRFCFKYIISSHLSHSVLRRATSVNNFHRAGRGGGGIFESAEGQPHLIPLLHSWIRILRISKNILVLGFFCLIKILDMLPFQFHSATVPSPMHFYNHGSLKLWCCILLYTVTKSTCIKFLWLYNFDL